MTAWSYTEADRDFVTRHVEPFLPDKVFDAHAHLFCRGDWQPGRVGKKNRPRITQIRRIHADLTWG